MKIAAMRAGGMGGWLGATLATAGNEVVFIAIGSIRSTPAPTCPARPQFCYHPPASWIADTNFPS